MIYRKQADFDSFRCIADKCPKSCCEGWQIVIDPNSLKKYKNHIGPFKDRLESGIDFQESTFRQYRMRCAMLSPSGLCDLQSTLGESCLCDTCRQYPRHTEEFPDLREYSLSLSCPEAVRMMTDPSYRFELTETEDDVFDDPEEFEDVDPFLFDQLTYAREELFALATDSSLSLQQRMDRIAAAAYALQEMYDEGDIFSMSALAYNDSVAEEPTAELGFPLSCEYMLESLDFLKELEVLEASWTDILNKTSAYWHGLDSHSAEWDQFMSMDAYAPTLTEPAYNNKKTAEVFETLLQSLLYTYFCGSIYDGQIYARAMIPIMSVRWMIMIHTALPQLSLEETIYLFSREVEHSDENINALISRFENEL